jgi:hypothetical protein
MPQQNWGALVEQAGGAFEPLPVGAYNAEITTSKSKPTANGKSMFAVTFKVMDGPYAGRTVWNNFVVSPENPNALAFFFQHMNALGLNRDFFLSLPPGPESDEKIAQALIGKRANITVSIRKYQGQDRNQVDKVTAIAGVPNVPAPAVGPAGGLPPVATAAPAPVPAAPAPAPVPQPAPVIEPPAPVADPIPQPAPAPAPPAPAPVPEPPAPAPEPTPAPVAEAPAVAPPAAPAPAPAPPAAPAGDAIAPPPAVPF